MFITLPLKNILLNIKYINLNIKTIAVIFNIIIIEIKYLFKLNIEFFFGDLGMRNNKRKRWYDSNPRLALLLNLLKNQDKECRDNIINHLKEIITKYDDTLIDRHVVDFPMTEKRRWYDQDPYSWLVINSIKYADKELIKRIISYLTTQLH